MISLLIRDVSQEGDEEGWEADDSGNSVDVDVLVVNGLYLLCVAGEGEHERVGGAAQLDDRNHNHADLALAPHVID